MAEAWRAVVGYEGKYEVSNHGRVRSLNFNKKKGKTQVRRLRKNNRDGYFYVDLWSNNKRKVFKVARLNAIAFIPNPLNLPQVDHINRDRADDRTENLRWSDGTQQNYNQKRRRDNTSGIRGISWDARDNLWVAQLKHKDEIYNRSFRDVQGAIDYLRGVRDMLGIGDIYHNEELDEMP